MGKLLVFEKGIACASTGGNTISRTLPRANISKIILQVGTTFTVSAGAVVANTMLKNIKLRINGKQQIDWTLGSEYDDTEAGGSFLLRELSKIQDRVALVNNRWEIRFPEPMPPSQVELQFTFQGAETIGADAGGTVTAGDIDIFYEVEPRARPNAIIPYIMGGVISHGTSTGQFYEYLPAVPYKLRALLFLTQDNGTKADDTYDSLLIKDQQSGTIFFDGSMADLRQEAQSKAQVALSTGAFYKSFGKEGVRVTPNSLLLQFAASTAGTAKYIEWIAICY